MPAPGKYAVLTLFLFLSLHSPAAPPAASSAALPAAPPAASPAAPPAASPTAPDSIPCIVGRIFIKGNRTTRTYIILRELSFKTGDTVELGTLVSAFREAHDRLFNTRLFNEVVVYVKEFHGQVADIGIDVKERWYIFPLPYLKPVDRNFTEWAQKGYGLDRIDYGGKFTHYNFTGRNDQLTAWLITGYARQFELYYNLPYVDKNLKHGFGFGFNYIEQNELDVMTTGDTQDFINSDTIAYAGKFLSRSLSFSARYFYRPGLKVRHTVNFNLVSVRIDSAVAVANPHYFNNGTLDVLYPEWAYTFNYTDVDYVAYPLDGIIFQSSLSRRGIDTQMDLWQLSARLTRSWPIGRKWWFGFQNVSVLKWPLSQPFYNQGLIGYGDMYLRGLDRYVVDGTAGAVLRNTLFRELFNFDIPFTRIASHDRIPFRIYATAFTDAGYAYNRDFTYNSLVNRMLYTAGVGIDIVTFYDLNFRFDYSFNQLGQNGLFLHIRNDF